MQYNSIKTDVALPNFYLAVSKNCMVTKFL